MRKIECACGINHQIYDWPMTEVEQNGVKMCERHITCPCKREIVTFTAPKYEPEAEIGEDEKIATVNSFAEVSRQFGVLKEAPEHNQSGAEKVETPDKQVKLSGPSRALFASLIENYAKWFKQGKVSADSQKKFFGLSEKVTKAEDGNIGLGDEERRMAKMALSERNLYHIWSDEIPKEAQESLADLRSALKEVL